MITRKCPIQTLLIVAVTALGLAVWHSSPAQSQDAVVDSAKQAEAKAAMEAAADSARKISESRAAGANRARQQRQADTTGKTQAVDTSAVKDTRRAVRENAAIAPKPLANENDTSKASVPDTTVNTATAVPGDSAKPQDTSAVVESTPEKPKTPVDPTAPYKEVVFAPDEKPRVVIETALGRIVLELYPDVAPKHCQNFVYQVNEGFYDSLLFHRVVLGYLIQGGDPQGTGTGGPGYTLPAEFSTKLLHEEGTLSMARRVDPAAKSGAVEKPEFLNSAGSQFFICTARASSLDGKYTIFGKVVEGLDVVHSIEKLPVQRERPVAPVYMTRVYVEPKA